MIRASTAATVVGIGGIAAVVSFRHALEVVRDNGESGVTAYLTPLTVDGLVFTASMVLLDAARRGDRAPMLARVALALGIAATVAVNVLHGLAHGPVGAVVGAWPAITLILVVELLMGMIRRGRQSAEAEPESGDVAEAAYRVGDDADPPQPVPESAPVPVPALAEGASTAVPEASSPAVPATSGARVPMSAEVRPARRTRPSGDPAEVRAVAVFSEEIAAGQVPSIRRIKSTLRCGQTKASQVREYLASLDSAARTPVTATAGKEVLS
ncbi:hypothetical protein BJY14_005056 [Actinomadura luteofluorescens]|uniref:DUF2637 domain-containing protein n=2 Tax=Actinomadura luteofluorescens TaxID=46163 RepID=A0A7Y9JHX6_9ACTN|nr:DUF2637 domain-containing protein [Actinomadura luteofluorescens]NYD49073.1 hypothetical protein [Actinomadura luteofluorescens]